MPIVKRERYLEDLVHYQGDAWERRRDGDGIIVMGLVDFLLDRDALRG